MKKGIKPWAIRLSNRANIKTANPDAQLMPGPAKTSADAAARVNPQGLTPVFRCSLLCTANILLKNHLTKLTYALTSIVNEGNHFLQNGIWALSG